MSWVPRHLRCIRGVRGIRTVRWYNYNAGGERLDFANEKQHNKYEKRRHVDVQKFNRSRHLGSEYSRHLMLLDPQHISQLLNEIEPTTQGSSGPIRNLSDFQAMDTRYYSPIEGTIRAIVHETIDTLLVELNLRRHVVGDIDDSRILVKDFDRFKSIDLERESGLVHLDHVESLASHDIYSLPHFRLIYNHYKSGEYLNHENAETIAFLSGVRTGYSSRQSDYGVFELQINAIFNVNCETQMDRISMMFEMVNVLTTTVSPPLMKVLKLILDHLNSHNLIAYLGIILRHICPYKFRASHLSDTKLAKLTALLYQEAIEEEPEILLSIFEFHHKAGNTDVIEQLLCFMLFEEIIELERIFNQSIYKGLISKSRFIKSRTIENLSTVNFQSKSPLMVSRETIHKIIEICSHHELYIYIDLLVNKAIFQLVGDKVLLTFNGNNDFHFTIDSDDVNGIILQLFTEDLIVLLLKVIEDSNDLGRLMWLIPNLDVYMTHWSQSQVSETCEPLNVSLIFQILKSLKRFGVEGKLMSYENMIGLSYSQVEELNSQM